MTLGALAVDSSSACSLMHSCSQGAQPPFPTQGPDLLEPLLSGPSPQLGAGRSSPTSDPADSGAWGLLVGPALPRGWAGLAVLPQVLGEFSPAEPCCEQG